ncbi:MAG TPA: PHP-associated domain-containing protein [Ktedonobacteraceae bacterium]|nr:PHP-associated domain-containing protein [Ktedonobacteraceae bacterium]
MTSVTNNIVTNESLCRGTEMLPKKKQMTRQQATYTGKMGRADLHMHSTFSDGLYTPAQILSHVEKNTDLDVIALTDHDEIEGSLRLRDLWQQGNYRFDIVVGEEISTKEGHLLALYIERLIPQGLSIERSIDMIHEQGGLAVIAHPLHRLFRHSCQREVMDRIHASEDVWLDGIETWNASFCGIYANGVAMKANREVYGLPELGNSDAHTLKSIGSGCTWFEGKSASDVRATIEAGLSAPGGKLWGMNDYIRIASHLVSHKAQKRLRNREQKVA